MPGLNATIEEDLCQNSSCVYKDEVLINIGTGITTYITTGVNNGSKLPYSLWITIVLGVAAFVAVTLTILGNIIVLLSFNLDRTLRKPTNYFIASLAVSDLLIGMFSMPSFTLYLLIGYWPLPEIVCDIWLSLDWTLCFVSQYNVLFITTDRFCSLKYPLRYKKWRTDKKVRVAIALLWIISSLGNFTTIIGWQYFVGERTVSAYACEVQFLSSPLFSFLFTIAYFWTPLIVMFTLYVGIYRIALSKQRKKKPCCAMELANLKDRATNTINESGEAMTCKQVGRKSLRCLGHAQDKETLTSSSNFQRHSHNEYLKPKEEDHSSSHSSATENRAPKALKTISIILGAYVLSWSPYHIMVFIKGICGDFTCISIHLYYFTYWLCYLNSSVNPFCYTFANKKFKRTFFKILNFDLRRV